MSRSVGRGGWYVNRSVFEFVWEGDDDFQGGVLSGSGIWRSSRMIELGIKDVLNCYWTE